jgi:hypothetical protein
MQRRGVEKGPAVRQLMAVMIVSFIDVSEELTALIFRWDYSVDGDNKQTASYHRSLTN